MIRIEDIEELVGILRANGVAGTTLAGGWGRLALKLAPMAAQPAATGGAQVLSPAIGHLRLAYPGREEALRPQGACVAAGDLLGLLQCGPLLVPVQAGSEGILVEILAEDGDEIGYGEAIFAISA